LSGGNSPGTALLDMQSPENLYKKAMLLQKRKDSDERSLMKIDDIMEEVNLNLADAEAHQSFERRTTLLRKEP